MEQIIEYGKTYQEYKAELDGVLQTTAEGFVKIGYLLKVARDTNVLAESGYATVTEFAQAEYNLDKTQVSRFIAINDRFSEGGYSDHLLPDYQGYGYAKLTIMLQIPESITEEMSANYSKAEVQAIREEMAEEEAVSDIERCIEGSSKNEQKMALQIEQELTSLQKLILQLGETEPELFVEISERKNEEVQEFLPEVMAPAGDKIYSVRVMGLGRMMLSISDMSDTVKVINSRSDEKEEYTWYDVAAAWTMAGVLGPADEDWSGVQCWEAAYGRKYPVAPVQQQAASKEKNVKPDKKPEKKKESKVTKARTTDWMSAYKLGQKVVQSGNGDVWMLDSKTEEPGYWNVYFNGICCRLHESQFTPYEEPEQTEEFNGTGDGEIIMGESDDQLPGQTSIVKDFKEILPESMSGENTEVAPVQPDPEPDGLVDFGNLPKAKKSRVALVIEIGQNIKELKEFLDCSYTVAEMPKWQLLKIQKLARELDQGISEYWEAGYEEHHA